MRAAVLREQKPGDQHPLTLENLTIPEPAANETLLKVLACGVCRTDLHIAEGDLPMRLPWVIPGHQIVGEVVRCGDGSLPHGTRVGVSWIGGVDGTCPYCKSGRENLCDNPVYTGYTHNGGYAEYATARTDFLLPLPPGLEPTVVAPLLCAGIIGYRSLKIAETKCGGRVGLFGFGSSAQLLMRVLHAWECEVYVSTRDKKQQELAHAMGAVWVGGATDVAPKPLESAITFAPVGEVVLAAIKSLGKGGIVAINAIHLDQMPAFDYDSLLWGERQIRSVTNMTREDGKEFLQIAEQIGIRPAVTRFSLEQANDALALVKRGLDGGSAVLVP